MLLPQVIFFCFTVLARARFLGHTTDVSHKHELRADEPTWWSKAVCKGGNLQDALLGSDKDAGALYEPPRDSARSQFHGTDDVFKWGYQEIDPDNQWRDFNGKRLGFAHVLRALQVSDKAEKYGGLVHCVEVTHGDLDWELDPLEDQVPLDKQTYNVWGKTYRVTGAFFRFGINAVQGVIIAMERESPFWSAQDRNPVVPASDLPALRQFSDISWAFWAKYTAQVQMPLKGIRYFLISDITNSESQNIIFQALYNKKANLGPWPGIDFEPWLEGKDDTDNEFKALLATPNSKFIGYFLAQHKAELGNMYVSKITVFHGDTWSQNPCLLFHVSGL